MSIFPHFRGFFVSGLFKKIACIYLISEVLKQNSWRSAVFGTGAEFPPCARVKQKKCCVFPATKYVLKHQNANIRILEVSQLTFFNVRFWKSTLRAFRQIYTLKRTTHDFGLACSDLPRMSSEQRLHLRTRALLPFPACVPFWKTEWRDARLRAKRMKKVFTAEVQKETQKSCF